MPLSVYKAGLVALGWLGLTGPGSSRAQVLTTKQIDSLVALTMRTFQVPGVALAVVKDGQLVCEQGYGGRVAGTQPPVDAHTLFAIASNSKAFTAAALGILVDEGNCTGTIRCWTTCPTFACTTPTCRPTSPFATC